MPLLQALYDSGFQVIGINAGLEDAAQITPWLAARAITFPIVVDGVDRTLEGLFQVRGLPTTFFIDAQGRIRFVQPGELTPEALAQGIAALGVE
jgi:hypothetical protein